jgi:DNA-binding NarL/FixJ family response regulator
MPIRVAVVEGDTLTRYGLRALVARQADIEVAVECETGEAASVIATVAPDVVIVDVTLPDGDGLRLAREFRLQSGSLGIVVLTSESNDNVLFQAMEDGASAVVAKTAPLDELLAAIRHAAIAGSSFTASGLGEAVTRRMATLGQLSISARETEVLRLLRDGLSIPAIAEAMFISRATAKTYVARLYDKLGAANRSQALMTAIHHGLITSRGT